MSNVGIEIMRSDIDNLLREKNEMRWEIQTLKQQVSKLQTVVENMGVVIVPTVGTNRLDS